MKWRHCVPLYLFSFFSPTFLFCSSLIWLFLITALPSWMRWLMWAKTVIWLTDVPLVHFPDAEMLAPYASILLPTFGLLGSVCFPTRLCVIFLLYPSTLLGQGRGILSEDFHSSNVLMFASLPKSTLVTYYITRWYNQLQQGSILPGQTLPNRHPKIEWTRPFMTSNTWYVITKSPFDHPQPSTVSKTYYPLLGFQQKSPAIPQSN